MMFKYMLRRMWKRITDLDTEVWFVILFVAYFLTFVISSLGLFEGRFDIVCSLVQFSVHLGWIFYYHKEVILPKFRKDKTRCREGSYVASLYQDSLGHEGLAKVQTLLYSSFILGIGLPPKYSILFYLIGLLSLLACLYLLPAYVRSTTRLFQECFLNPGVLHAKGFTKKRIVWEVAVEHGKRIQIIVAGG